MCAAADGELQHLEVNLVKSRCIEQAVEERVHTADHGKVLFLAFFDQTLHVARVSNQHHASAPLKEAAQSGQRKDVIERKRCHNDFGLLLEVAGNPNTRLLQVGQHIAVREHGAFGNAGCAACVLQKCDVIAVELDRIKFSGSALGECVAERDSVFEIELGHHLLYFLQHEVNE